MSRDLRSEYQAVKELLEPSRPQYEQDPQYLADCREKLEKLKREKTLLGKLKKLLGRK